jgi:hypothetical protein
MEGSGTGILASSDEVMVNDCLTRGRSTRALSRHCGEPLRRSHPACAPVRIVSLSRARIRATRWLATTAVVGFDFADFAAYNAALPTR